MTPEFLQDHSLRLLFFGGKGGVGKTTCASATALNLAHRDPEKTVCLVSTDPAHSVMDSLGGEELPANLHIEELDAAKELDRFMEAHGEVVLEIADRGTFFEKEDLRSFLGLSMPGIDELMAFRTLAEWIDQDRFDCIVVDTAPTGHTLRLLEMPQLLKKWLQAMDALLAKYRYIKMSFARHYTPDELDEFLLEFNEVVHHAKEIIQDSAVTRFIPVMVGERASVEETRGLLGRLEKASIPVTTIVINRIIPEVDSELLCSLRISQARELRRFMEMAKLKGFDLIGLMRHPQEIRGVSRLSALWEEVLNIPELVASVKGARQRTMLPEVLAPCGEVPATLKLFMVAGKGGVGKSTFATATAYHLARQSPREKVLLFSTDPAHSLSQVLEQKVGREPIQVAGAENLFAQQISARKDYSGFRSRYRSEVEQFLNSAMPNIDLTYDREVLEHFLDLAPTGLDEIMAVSHLMDHLEGGEFDRIVVDSAPTGHMLRLLEMPSLIAEWLKSFFSLLLKYRDMLHLPKLNQQLVALSKKIKSFQSVLGSALHSACMVVALPTQLAFEETRDLFAAIDRIGMAVHSLFINRLFPNVGCDYCEKVRVGEGEVVKQFDEEFGGCCRGRVTLGSQPLEQATLVGLGGALFG